MMFDALRRHDDPGLAETRSSLRLDTDAMRPGLDLLRLAAGNAIDVPISRRRSARHERHFRWGVRCFWLSLGAAVLLAVLEECVSG